MSGALEKMTAALNDGEGRVGLTVTMTLTAKLSASNTARGTRDLLGAVSKFAEAYAEDFVPLLAKAAARDTSDTTCVGTIDCALETSRIEVS